jgi:hypothetical protein
MPVEDRAHLACMVGEIAAVQPHPGQLDPVRRQFRGQPRHLLRPGLGVVGVDQQDHRLRARAGEILEGPLLAVMGLDERMGHGAVYRHAI